MKLEKPNSQPPTSEGQNARVTRRHRRKAKNAASTGLSSIARSKANRGPAIAVTGAKISAAPGTSVP